MHQASCQTAQPFAALIASHCQRRSPPLCEALQTYEAQQLLPFWLAVEQHFGISEAPFWGWSWPGSIALARYLLDTPELVRGRRVLDLGAGNGLAALAASRAGAALVIANDIDPLALRLIALHARLNKVTICTESRNLLYESPENVMCDVIIVGDLFYSRNLAQRLIPWLRHCCRLGRLVLLGEPGRRYAPQDRLIRLASYATPVPQELENCQVRTTHVLSMQQSAARKTGNGGQLETSRKTT